MPSDRALELAKRACHACAAGDRVEQDIGGVYIHPDTDKYDLELGRDTEPSSPSSCNASVIFALDHDGLFEHGVSWHVPRPGLMRARNT